MVAPAIGAALIGGGASLLGSLFGGGGGNSNPQQQPYQMDPFIKQLLQEQAQRDAQQQEFSLQRQREGYEQGGAIYDYLLNDVYGSVLGAQFSGGEQEQAAPGISQIGSGAKKKQNMNYGFGGGAPTISQMGPQGPGNYTTQQVGEMPAWKDFSGQSAPNGMGKSTGIQQGSAGPNYSTAAPPVGSPVLIATANGTVVYDPKTGTHGYDPNPTPPNALPPAYAGQLMTQYEQARQAAGVQPGQQYTQPWPETIKPHASLAEYQTKYEPFKTQQAPKVSDATYKSTGVSAMDPNMSKTWARFLAPTYGKISEMSDAEMRQIQRVMPRGGEQDQAIGDAIRGKYGAIQQGWQQLVPKALDGISTIGKDLYHQQPTPNSGALGQQLNYDSNMAQMANQNNQNSQQRKADMWGNIGQGISNIGQGLLSGLGNQNKPATQQPGPWADGYKF